MASLPASLAGRPVIVLDPMLATGGSLLHCLRLLADRGADDLTVICALAAPEGVAALEASGLPVRLFTASIDERLNENAYIVPGLGDAGDRQFGGPRYADCPARHAGYSSSAASTSARRRGEVVGGVFGRAVGEHHLQVGLAASARCRTGGPPPGRRRSAAAARRRPAAGRRPCTGRPSSVAGGSARSRAIVSAMIARSSTRTETWSVAYRPYSAASSSSRCGSDEPARP